MTASDSRRDRLRTIAITLGLPIVIAAAGAFALEVLRVVRPESSIFMTPRDASLADAIATGEALPVYELIHSGHDPNTHIVVTHPKLTRNQTVTVAPLVWAVATENNQSVALLLSVGARVDPETHRRTVCLAQQLGNDDVARLLESYGDAAAAGGPCPPPEENDLIAIARPDAAR